jgi:hypothetical protein
MSTSCGPDRRWCGRSSISDYRLWRTGPAGRWPIPECTGRILADPAVSFGCGGWPSARCCKFSSVSSGGICIRRAATTRCRIASDGSVSARPPSGPFEERQGTSTVDVDAVEQVARRFLTDSGVSGGPCTGRRGARIGEIAARAGVHGGYEHEAWTDRSRVVSGPGDGDLKVFQRLAQDLQHIFLVFGQFVQKQDRRCGPGSPRRGGECVRRR